MKNNEPYGKWTGDLEISTHPNHADTRASIDDWGGPWEDLDGDGQDDNPDPNPPGDDPGQPGPEDDPPGEDDDDGDPDDPTEPPEDPLPEGPAPEECSWEDLRARLMEYLPPMEGVGRDDPPAFSGQLGQPEHLIEWEVDMRPSEAGAIAIQGFRLAFLAFAILTFVWYLMEDLTTW